MNENLWIVLGCLVVFGLVAAIMTKLAKWNYSSFDKAKAVEEKLRCRFGDKPWCTWIIAKKDDKYGHVVYLGFDPDLLRFKSDEFQYFFFDQEVDGVQVLLRPMAWAAMPAIKVDK